MIIKWIPATMITTNKNSTVIYHMKTIFSPSSLHRIIMTSLDSVEGLQHNDMPKISYSENLNTVLLVCLQFSTSCLSKQTNNQTNQKTNIQTTTNKNKQTNKQKTPCTTKANFRHSLNKM